jgi:hypothetical protein
MDCDQRPAVQDEGRVIGPRGACEVLAQGHDREQTDDADRDERGLDNAHGHIAERQAFALAPEDRVERHCRADAGDEGDDLAHSPQLHAEVAAAADDEGVVIEHLVIQRQSRDRDERDDEEDARDARASSLCVRRSVARCGRRPVR